MAPRGPARLGAALLVLLLLPLLPAAAHAPNPAPDWTHRILVDQNDDITVCQQCGGHDLVALDVLEAWDEQRREPQLVFRLVVDGGYATTGPDSSGTLKDVFTFTVGPTSFTRSFQTTDNQGFEGDFDTVGPRVDESGTGHGDYSITLGMWYSTLGAKEGDVLKKDGFKVEAFVNNNRRDVMPGGIYNQVGTYQDSLEEQNSPIQENNLPYTLRGPGYMVGIAAPTTGLQVQPNGTATLNVTLTNKLATTAQSLRLAVGQAPAGWNVSANTTGATVAAGASRTVEVTVQAGASPASGEVLLEALGAKGGRAALALALAPPPPPGTPLEVRSLRAEPGPDRAVVRWNTTVPASGHVDYGTGPALGSTASQPALLTSHGLTLTGLQPATTYHYRVRAQNATANATSATQAFTTLPAPSLAIEAPAAGATLNGTVEVRVGVRNWSGPVELLLDNQPLASLDAPYPAHRWTTRDVANGPHTLAARAGAFTSPGVQVTVANPERSLTGGRVEPASGAETQEFTFSVHYRDGSGAPPVAARVLVDGAPHDLAPDEGHGHADEAHAHEGKAYKARLRLAPGQHTHVFVFTTPDGTLRFPASGTLPGPFVEAAAPPPPPPVEEEPPVIMPPPSPPPPGPPAANATPGPSVLAAFAALGLAALRPGRRAALLATMVLALLAAAGPAWGHESLTEGDFTLVAGWAQEPPLAGVYNAVEVTVIRAGQPVTGVNTLRLELSYGPDTMLLEYKPRGGTQGVYDAPIIPSREGQYRLRIGGSVQDTPLNLTFAKIEVVQPASDLMFPAPASEGPDPAVQGLQQRVDAAEARVAALEARKSPGPGAGLLVLAAAAAVVVLAAARRGR